MQIGIGLPNQVRNLDPRVIPRWAATAEERGFSTLGTVGRYAYPGVSDTVALAAAAGATSTIGLLTHVLLAPTWPAHLLAKEVAGIDGVSGGRLTLGLGVGTREDDFVVEGFGPRGRGKRFDADLSVYTSVWDGEPIGGDGGNPAVPAGTRRVPLLFGAFSPAAMSRAVREGDGYIGGTVPAQLVAQSFDQARAAWQEAGRSGAPRLVALAYVATRDADRARSNVHDYYTASGAELADTVANNLAEGPDAIHATVRGFSDIGADELILVPGTDDVDEVSRVADVVL